MSFPLAEDTPLVHRPTATLLNLHTGSKTNLFYSKPVRVILALFSADEAFVVLLTQDAAYSFGVESGKVRHKWEEARKDGEFSHNTRERLQRCTHILSNNQLVIRGFDAEISKVIFRRDLRTGDTIYEMRGHICPVDIIALNQEHTLAAVATTSPDVRTNDVVHKIVHIWDLEWGKMLSKVGGGVGGKGGSIVSAIAFCGVQDEYCITNCTDGEPAVQMWYIGIRLNPISPAIPIHELICHNRPIIFMQVANHGETLVTASMDNTVALWDLPKVYERCEKELQGQQKAEKVNQKILDEIFKNKVAEATAPYEPGEGMMVATSLSISKDGLVGVVGTRDGWVIFYNLETLEMTSYNRVAMRKPVNFMLTTKSGRFIISAATDLRVWIPETGELLHTFVVARRERIDSMAESNDVLVAGFSGRECCGMVWDLKSGLRLRRLEGLYGFSKVAITSDASKVVGVFFDFPMIFNVRSGEPENSSQMETAEYDCTCLRISPDDRMVVSASTDGSVKVMDFKTGMYRLRLQHQSPVLEALFSPDSSLVLTAGFKSVFIWSAHDGTQLGMLSEHQAAIEKLMFSVGDRFLLSCSRDRQVIVWDFESRTPVTNFHAHCPMTVMAVADDLTTVLFGPENISYVGILKSNPAFRMLIGDYVPPTPIEEKAPQDMDWGAGWV